MDFKPWWPPRQQRRGEGILLPFHGRICPGKPNLPFELLGRAGDCSRVTEGQKRPHLGKLNFFLQSPWAEVGGLLGLVEPGNLILL